MSEFLRYVVLETLDGRGETLKERTIGANVFGRAPDYDTGSDASVRISAGELRKRIAQYYHEAGHEDEIRIDFPTGSYHPTFRLPVVKSPAGPNADSDTSLSASPHDLSTQVADPVGTSPTAAANTHIIWFHQPHWRIVALAILVIGVAAALLVIVNRSQQAAVDKLWSPALNSPGPMLLLIGGNGTTPAVDPSEPLSAKEYQNASVMNLGDAMTLARMTNLLGQHNKPYQIEYSSRTDLTRLRTGPAALIGSFNNSWSRELTCRLRFYFATDVPGQLSWIEDAKNKGSREWQVRDAAPATEDYAIVARFRDPATEHPVIIAGGLTFWGTRAAGEFLTNQNYVNDLMKLAPKTWKGTNVEAVISTTIIQGVSGPPRIAAVEFW